jgi:heptosyltransferase-1
MERWLVIKPSSLGDIIHGLQVMQAAAEACGPVEITWVAGDSFASLVEQAAVVNRVVVFKRRGGVGAFLRLLGELRRERYDRVIDLQGLARSGLMTWAVRAKQKMGRGDSREGARLAYGQRTPWRGGAPRHAVDILAEFLPLLGSAVTPARRINWKTRPLSDDLQSVVSEAVLLFPDSRRPEKQWPYFAELTTLLTRRYPERRFVWLGSQPGAGSQLVAELPSVTDCCGKTALADLPALISQAALVVANDSGPMHLAAAAGKPVVALFGPTDPACYGPWPLADPAHQVICAPDGDLSRLTPDVVAEAVGQMLPGLP